MLVHATTGNGAKPARGGGPLETVRMANRDRLHGTHGCVTLFVRSSTTVCRRSGLDASDLWIEVGGPFAGAGWAVGRIDSS